MSDLIGYLRDKLAAKTCVTDGCWLWTGLVNNHGYGRLALRNGKGGYHVQYAHRAAYIAAYGPIPKGKLVRHSCDNPRCVRPDHLLLGTQGDNMRDMASRDRHPLHHPKAVRDEIVRRVEAGHSIAAVARELDVPYAMATAVIHRRRHAAN